MVLVPVADAGVGQAAMRMVVTLIAASRDPALPRFVAAVAAALAIPAEPVWLAAETACDLFLDTDSPAAIAATVRNVLGSARIDVLVQPQHGRRKRLLVADLESTVIENEMLDELAGLLGIGPLIAGITRRAMNGEIDFEAALEARVGMLAGIDTAILDRAAGRIRPTAGAGTLVRTMRRHGAMTALATGGFAVFAEQVAARLGFDRVIANRLEIVANRVTGRVLPPIVTGAGKREALLTLAHGAGLSPADALAVGDGANDLAMLAAAGLGVAFRAKPGVAATARWRLDHADLSGLLYAQGYRMEEFAE
ncbi:MAG: phosphoserine phosphatase SerB [Stellaceae bacterium]